MNEKWQELGGSTSSFPSLCISKVNVRAVEVVLGKWVGGWVAFVFRGVVHKIWAIYL